MTLLGKEMQLNSVFVLYLHHIAIELLDNREILRSRNECVPKVTFFYLLQVYKDVEYINFINYKCLYFFCI